MSPRQPSIGVRPLAAPPQKPGENALAPAGVERCHHNCRRDWCRNEHFRCDHCSVQQDRWNRRYMAPSHCSSSDWAKAGVAIRASDAAASIREALYFHGVSFSCRVRTRQKRWKQSFGCNEQKKFRGVVGCIRSVADKSLFAKDCSGQSDGFPAATPLAQAHWKL